MPPEWNDTKRSFISFIRSGCVCCSHSYPPPSPFTVISGRPYIVVVSTCMQVTRATCRRTTHVTTMTRAARTGVDWRTSAAYFLSRRPASSRPGSSRTSPSVHVFASSLVHAYEITDTDSVRAQDLDPHKISVGWGHLWLGPSRKVDWKIKNFQLAYDFQWIVTVVIIFEQSWLELRPGPHWGAYNAANPEPLTGFRGGGEEIQGERKGRWKEREWN